MLIHLNDYKPHETKSAQDLIDQVSQSLPEGCPIPLEQWVNLNFAQEIQE